MSSSVTIYVFREPQLAPSGDTIVSVAPREVIETVYGGGGIWGNGGLVAAFDGAAVYRDEQSSQFYLGVWGARKASKFRNTIRKAGMTIEIVKAPPPGRLVLY